MMIQFFRKRYRAERNGPVVWVQCEQCDIISDLGIELEPI